MKRMKIMAMVLLLLPIMLVHQGCAPGGTDPGTTQTPVETPPSLSSISPHSDLVNTGDVTLAVNGSNFSSASKIVFNGVEQVTTFESSSRLSCVLSNADLVEIANNAAASTASSGLSGTQANADLEIPVKVSTTGKSDTSEADFTLKYNYSSAGSVVNFTDIAREDEPLFVRSADDTLFFFWSEYDSLDQDRVPLTEGVYFSKSTDNGDTWTQGIKCIEPGEDTIKAYDSLRAAFCHSDGTLYLVTARGCLAKSTDSGESWECHDVERLWSDWSVDRTLKPRYTKWFCSPQGVPFCLRCEMEGDVWGRIYFNLYKINQNGNEHELVKFTDVFSVGGDYYIRPTRSVFVDRNGMVYIVFAAHGSDASGSNRLGSGYYLITPQDLSYKFWNQPTYIGYCDTLLEYRYVAFSFGFHEDGKVVLATPDPLDNGKSLVTYVSNDFGVTWNSQHSESPFDKPSDEPFSGMDPNSALIDERGNVVFSYDGEWVRSIDKGETWSDELDIDGYVSASGNLQVLYAIGAGCNGGWYYDGATYYIGIPRFQKISE